MINDRTCVHDKLGLHGVVQSPINFILAALLVQCSDGMYMYCQILEVSIFMIAMPIKI